MPASRKVSYTLAANEEITCNQVGSYVRCIDAGEAFTVEAQKDRGGSRQVTSLNKGLGIEFDHFDRIRIINGDNAQTIVIYVGDLRVDDSSLHGSVNATFAANGNLSDKTDVTISSNTNALIAAANANRKDIHIVNLSGSNTLRVGTSNANATRGLPVGYGLSMTLSNFDGALYGYADGADIDVAVLEVLT